MYNLPNFFAFLRASLNISLPDTQPLVAHPSGFLGPYIFYVVPDVVFEFPTEFHVSEYDL